MKQYTVIDKDIKESSTIEADSFLSAIALYAHRTYNSDDVVYEDEEPMFITPLQVLDGIESHTFQVCPILEFVITELV